MALDSGPDICVFNVCFHVLVEDLSRHQTDQLRLLARRACSIGILHATEDRIAVEQARRQREVIDDEQHRHRHDGLATPRVLLD